MSVTTMILKPKNMALDSNYASSNIFIPMQESDLLKSRDAITEFLFIQDEPAPVDFAFVLGAPNLSNIEPAINLYRKGFTQAIVISGFGPQKTPDTTSPSEAEILKNYAIRSGIPADKILIEIESTNTLENFCFTRPLIETHFGWHKITQVAICGQPFHMRRALMTARRQWPSHVKLLMTPSNHPDDPNPMTWWQSNAGKAFVFRELNAISIYAMKGDIGDF